MGAEIVRYEDRQVHGLARRDVYGLNLFVDNEVGVPEEQEPRAVFLNALITGGSVAVHTGNFAGSANVDACEFGPPTADNDYVTTRQNLYEGSFWQEKLGRPPAFLFPLERRPFLGLEPQAFLELISTGSIAVYTGVDPGNPAPLLDLATQPPTEVWAGERQEGWQQHARDAQWLQAITRVCRLAVVTGHDGRDFSCYARNAEDFPFLGPALAAAVRAVEETPWYRANASRLAWDSEMDLCLKALELPPGS